MESSYTNHKSQDDASTDVDSICSTDYLIDPNKPSRARCYSSIALSMPPVDTARQPCETRSEHMSCAIIGFSDGLTVPFALTAGLSAIGSSRVVIVGGLAELFAGAISMGLGAWLAAVTEGKHFEVEERKGYRDAREKPQALVEDVYEIFAGYAISRDAATPLVQQLQGSEDMLVKFLLRFQQQIAKPDKNAAIKSALVMAISYFVGGIVPMLSYFICGTIAQALLTSTAITVVILLLFGYVKAVAIGAGKKAAIMSALQTLVVGLLAAGASYGIVRGVNQRLGGLSD